MTKLWKEAHAAVCSIVVRHGHEVVGTGTGFRVGAWLVTNRHVLPEPRDDRTVEIKFVREDGCTPSIAPLTYSAVEFDARVRAGDDEGRWDLALVELADPAFLALPSLQLEDAVPPVGAPIGVLGFHFDQPRLSIHGGHLAARFVHDDTGVRYLQLDASINNGNSGGPLLDLTSAKVIGIVTRKETGLTKQFAQLISTFDENIQILDAARGGAAWGIGGGRQIELFPAMRAVQVQLRRLALEIERSANVGIGFAYELDRVRETLARFAA